MTVLSAQSIRRFKLVTPCLEAGRDANGNSFGLSACSYDLTLVEEVRLKRGWFKLSAAVEYFDLPANIMGIVHDKSSLARRGLSVFNTLLDPGWRGYLTLELKNQGLDHLHFPAGSAIAQVVFHWLDETTELPYRGKYQDQEAGPQPARSR